jgi:tetratricopeptide (TPR) repeat protein
VLCLIALPLAALAQSVRWDPPGGQLGFNQVSQLSLVFEDCEPDGAPAMPVVDGLQFAGRPSQSSQTSIVNFKMSRTFTLIYPVRPTKRAIVAIPEFTVQTDKGALKVPAARYTIGDAPVGNSGLSVGDISSAELVVPNSSVWAGEVFPVTYTLNVVRRYFHSLGSNVEWPAAPAVADDWTKPDPSETILQGERRVISEQTTRATIKQPGIYTLKPASQLVNIMVGSSGFGLFTQPNVEQRQIDSKPLEITVKPLPPAPAGFTGAVGEFAFVSKVVPVTAAVGEPITWTLELTGTGNWPDIAGLPSREVSNDFQVVQPKSKRTMKEGTLFEGSLNEDVVLVPTKAGTYKLPAMRFSYFDPKSGTYKSIATEAVTLTVTGTSAAVVPPAGSGAPVQFSLTPPSPSPNLPTPPLGTAPVPPENLPRDPLPAAATGFVPMLLRPLVWTCLLSAILCPLLAWLLLAAARSRALDPERARREARATIANVLAQLRQRASQGGSPADLLIAWQGATATLWNIPHAAPGSPLVHASVGRLSADSASTWARLWSEADRALHGREATLPADWLTRADSAVHAAKVPGWNPFALFGGRNLFPFLFTFAFLLLLPAVGRADAASDAYKRGDFAAAATEWGKAVAATPNDWAARHNLGLALGQQDRWAEATAHWTSAFLLNPRAPETRWDLALGLQRSGLAQPDLVELSRGDGAYEIARLASPGQWQLGLIAAGLLFAAALIVLLLQAYKRIGGWGAPVAILTGLVAMLLAAAGTFSLHTYGDLANPGAVFVREATTLRSIPTDADTAQKTSPLSSGSIAVVEKSFLGWTKLTFAGGQSGWVRTETLVPLYR